MTPEAFAALHPRLWRICARGSAAGIRPHGLLPASELAARAGHALTPARRPRAVALTLPDGTPVTLTDNAPLSELRLSRILDDGLTAADWMTMLNARVFFWPSKASGESNAKARRKLGYEDEWHAFETLALLTPVWDRAEIAPFNTGATIHVPPRRGRATFAPLAGLDLAEWRGRRRAAGTVRGLDVVREVTVRGGIPHAADALREILPA